jgi:hypothetical protein
MYGYWRKSGMGSLLSPLQRSKIIAVAGFETHSVSRRRDSIIY